MIKAATAVIVVALLILIVFVLYTNGASELGKSVFSPIRLGGN